MKKSFFLVLVLLKVSFTYAYDSAYIYFVPLTTSVAHNLSAKNISSYVKPFVIFDSGKIGKLYRIIEDSSKGKWLNNVSKSSCYKDDIRIYVVFFDNSKIKNEFMFETGNGNILNKKRRYKLTSSRYLMKFIVNEFVPITEKQVVYFKAIKYELNHLE